MAKGNPIKPNIFKNDWVYTPAIREFKLDVRMKIFSEMNTNIG